MHSLKDAPFDLVLSGATKSYGDRTLWKDLSLTVRSGQLTAVTGPSGSGKTTLLNCVGLLERLDAGTVSFGPWSFSSASRATPRSSRRACFRDVLGFLFQNYGLVESWSVQKNLRLACGVAGPASGSRRAMAEALARVGMSGAEKATVYSLSGGEQQRVALARLILKAPSLVLADEPTSALDSANADLVMEVLAGQAAGGALVLVSTHSDQIAGQCSTVVTLPQGGARPGEPLQGAQVRDGVGR